MIKISPKIIDKILKNQEKNFGGITHSEYPVKEQVKKHFSNMDSSILHLERLEESVTLTKKMKILDLGCGYGLFVLLLKKQGFNVWGCDVDKKTIEIGKEIFKENKANPKLIKVNDKKFPYPNSSFDFIYIKYVLSYVKDLDVFFKEIRRVLKKNGKAYIINPNNQCFYEFNYGVIMIPWLPKIINKVYLRLRGRRASYLNGVNFITRRTLEKLFKKNNFQFTDLGIRDWLKNIDHPNPWGRSVTLKKVYRNMDRFHLKPLLRYLAKLGFYTPFVYILEKEN